MKTKVLTLCIALLVGVSVWADEIWNYNVYDDCSKNGYHVGYSPAPADVEAVDLGLPSGIKWASCNVGATKPEDYGNYYAWGEVLPKDDYSWETYKYANGTAALTKYCDRAIWGNNGFTDNKTTLDPEDDVAHINWEGDWRMPTSEDVDELLNNCTWKWTTKNGVKGCKVISKTNSNSIFLPAAGYRNGTSANDVGSYGYYWSDTLDDVLLALCLNFGSVSWYETRHNRLNGLSVRPVCPSYSTASTSSSYVTLTLYADGCESANVIRCNAGQQVSVTTVPADEHRHFVRWADGNTDNPRLVTVTKDMVLTAEFADDPILTVVSANEKMGTVSGAGQFKPNSSCEISATANFGCYFTKWSDGDTNNPRTVVLTKNTTFTAEFAYNQYTITTEVNDAERGSVNRGTTIEYLSNVTLTATANYGYHFARWTDGNTDNPRTVEVTGNKTYTAVFEKNTYTITAQADDEARGSVSAPNQAEYLDEIKLTATANLGYHFTQWSDGVINNPRTVVLTKDTTFTAEFAQTYSGKCGDNLYWNYAGHTLTISGRGDMYDYTSDASMPWRLLCDAIEEVVLPQGITHIGSYAFLDCIGLTSVTIPNSITSIGKSAFRDCTGLTSITIPSSITSIGKRAFNGCTGLTSVTIPNSVKSIGEETFYGCTGLTSVTIGNSVTSIGEETFYGCTGLTCITIPNSVMSIGSSAFYECTGLTSVTIGNSVTSIGDNAFSGCTGLTSITIPNSVTSIGSSAFYECTGLTAVVWNAKNCSGWSYYWDSPFYFYAVRKNITSFTFGDEVERIPFYLCYGMSKLTDITIPNSVTSIGSCAFSGCSGLTSVTIPNSVMSIGSSAFNACTGLTSVTIGNRVTSIGNYAFDDCTGLASVEWNVKQYSNTHKYSPFADAKNSITSFTIGDAVESIPSYLCYGMSKLSSVTIGNGVTSIGDSVFAGCTGLNSVVWNAKNCNESGATASPFASVKENIASFTFGEEVESVPAYLCCGMSKLSALAIPNSVTTIGKAAFSGCAAVSSATMGNSITTIGDSAFAGCAELLEMRVPNSTNTIGAYAFSGCKNMETISFGAGLSSMGDYALDGCQSIYEMTCYATKVPTVESNTFRDVSTRADLYVPSTCVKKYKTHAYWGVFNVQAIEAETVPSSGSVVVRPRENEVVITWPIDEDADTYTIRITKDEVVFCSLVFDADGQLTNIAFAAPARNGEQHNAPAAVLTQSGYRFTVSGLNSGTAYAYDITVKDYDENVLQSYSGSFTTKGSTPTGVYESSVSGGAAQKVLRNGQVLILRNDKTYTVTGVEVK